MSVALKRAGCGLALVALKNPLLCVANGISAKQCHSKCSNWQPSIWILASSLFTPHEFIITGDFNIHLDNPADTLAAQFLSLLSSFNLSQHVHFPTHDKNHIFDLVITSPDTSLAPAVSCTHCSPSDHFPVFTRLSINPAPLPPPTLHFFRQLHSIDVGSFLTDLESSQLISDPQKSLGPLLSAYNTTLSSLLDKHAPIVSKLSRRQSPSNSWFSATLRAFRSTLRHAETSGNVLTLLLTGPLQVSPQPIPQAHPVFQKRVLLQPGIFSLRQPQTSLANSQ